MLPWLSGVNDSASAYIFSCIREICLPSKFIRMFYLYLFYHLYFEWNVFKEKVCFRSSCFHFVRRDIFKTLLSLLMNFAFQKKKKINNVNLHKFTENDKSFCKQIRFEVFKRFNVNNVYNNIQWELTAI